MITVNNLTKTYGKFNALRNISLEINDGEFVAIIGESGSGKSTLLNIIGQIDFPSSGEIIVDGENTVGLDDKETAKLRNSTFGFVFQAFYLEPTYTVYRNVEIPLILKGMKRKDRKQRIEEVLNSVDMQDKLKNKASNLSGGEMQRVAIARAIANNPPIIIADEPCGNLDTKNGDVVMRLLRDLHEQGKTILMVTHSYEHSKWADRVSFNNILHKKMAYAKVIIGFFLAFLVNFLVLFYSNSLTNGYEDYENSSADLKMISVFGNLTDENMSDIKSFSQVGGVTYGTSIYFDFEQKLKINFGDNEYELDDNNIIYSLFYLNKSSDSGIPLNYDIVLKQTTNQSAILAGTDMKNDNDILVSEIVLQYLGITNLQAALGKEIQIENGELKFEGTICGILNRQLIEDQNFLECFVAYKSEDCNISDDYCYISLTTFKNSNKLVSFIESILTDDSDYFWFGTNIEEIMAIIESQKELCNSFLSFLSLIIVLVICIYISSNQFYLLQKNSLFYGILKAHGVNNKGVFWVFFLELFLMCILAELFAILLSIGIFSAIKSIISEVFFIDLGLPLNVVAWSVPVFLALGLFLSLSITFFVYYILIIQ